MDERMTVCNMSIEAGARAGLIAPDDVTFEWVKGRRYAPAGNDWDAAVARWKTLPSDDGASYDRSVSLNASELEPMITYGTSPGMGIPISARVPDPADAKGTVERESLVKALRHHGLAAGQNSAGHPSR
jgi:3-isopropylmalate/(R)-2-methylmalate dehydratase large subunit